MVRLSLSVIICLVSTLTSVQPAFAQVGSVIISIPRKGTNTASSLPPIRKVKAIISVTTGDAVTFTITPNASPTPLSASFKTVIPGDVQPADLPFTYSGLASSIRDTVSLIPPKNSNDPPIYEIWFDVLSDSSSSCSTPQPARTFTVSAAGPKITGVCLESFDIGAQGSCAPQVVPTRYIPIPLVGLDEFASVSGKPLPRSGCTDHRPPVDVVMVLDKSGSMSADTKFGVGCTVPPCKRMESLHFAVNNFVQVWSGLTAAPDKIGAVLFSSGADWWHDGGLTDGLHDLTAVSGQISTNLSSSNCSNAAKCGELVPTLSTSIGAGILTANNATNGLRSVLNDGSRHVILLMSDGLQNTDPIVAASGAQVLTSCPSNSAACSGFGVAAGSTALANTPQIYTVTLGPSTGVAMVNQGIATASHGFYLNTEDNENLLGPFFLELLQNFLAQTSYETVRTLSASTHYSVPIPISATSHDVEFSLMWPKNLGVVRLTITPPGGAKPIVQENASGFISMIQTLPLPSPFDPMKDWTIKVEAITHGAPTGVMSTSVPFDLHIMTDDAAIKTDLAIVPGDYKPGDLIRLRAKLTQFGQPILGLGSHPGDRIEAELIRPGESIGDMLSDSTASAVPSCSPPAPCDQQTPAEAKLANTLAADPSKLKRVKAPSVTLYDDGRPEHGDDVAGDGIYNSLYLADMPGHYNFLFAVESTDASALRFSRQQLRTAYVRAVPDRDKTVLQSNIKPCTMRLAPVAGPGPTTPSAGGQACTLVVTMKPRTKFGNRMGPGWANYFWFTAPGFAPIKAIDSPNLDGTYTATLNFTGSKPPEVSLHFENVIAIIGDSVTPDHLPQPLDSNNVLAKVPPPPSGKFAVFADLGAGIPNGTFGNAFSTGVSFNGGLEYILNPHFSAEGILGLHHFGGKLTGDLNVFQFTGGGKVYSSPFGGNNLAFVRAGLGGYRFSLGPSTSFGGYVGGGVLHKFDDHWGVEGVYTFHAVNTTGGATKFSTIQGGIRYVF
jgi:hypothetical protein